jgi:hypothetical protein
MTLMTQDDCMHLADCINPLLSCADPQLTSLDLSGLAAVSDALAPTLVTLTSLVVLQLNHTSCGDRTVEWLTYGNRLHQWTAATRRQHSTVQLTAAQHTAAGVAAAPMGAGGGDVLASQAWPRCGADSCLLEVFMCFLCDLLQPHCMFCISLTPCWCAPGPGTWTWDLTDCKSPASGYLLTCSHLYAVFAETSPQLPAITNLLLIDRLAFDCVPVTPAGSQDQDQLLAPGIHSSDTCCCGPTHQLP